MDFSLITDIVIPEGVVLQIDNESNTIWTKEITTLNYSTRSDGYAAYAYAEKYIYNLSGVLSNTILTSSYSSTNKCYYANCEMVIAGALTEIPTRMFSKIIYDSDEYNGAGNYGVYLTSITIPDGVTKINSLAFLDEYYLTKITIPTSVTYISTLVFDLCRDVSLNYLGTIKLCKAIESNGDWTYWRDLDDYTYGKVGSSHTVHCSDGDVDL